MCKCPAYEYIVLKLKTFECDDAECKVRAEFEEERAKLKTEWHKEVHGLKKTHKKEMDVRTWGAVA